MASEPHQSLKPKRDRSGENFDRCAKRLVGKCDRLKKKYQADVYIVIRRKNKPLITYASCSSSSWPPTNEDIVRMPPFGLELPLTTPKDRYYPPPIRKTPADFGLGKESIA